MFLLYKEGLRIVITTANLIARDWDQKTQGYRKNHLLFLSPSFSFDFHGKRWLVHIAIYYYCYYYYHYYFIFICSQECLLLNLVWNKFIFNKKKIGSKDCQKNLKKRWMSTHYGHSFLCQVVFTANDNNIVGKAAYIFISVASRYCACGWAFWKLWFHFNALTIPCITH